nr:cation:proton antiporter [Nakamurella flavida]
MCCVGSIAVWSLAAGRLETWRVSPALVLAVLGAVVGLFVRPEIIEVLDFPVTEQIIELILATLLFSDAIAVRGRMLGSSPAVSSRLLFVALPLSLALAAAVGVLVLPGHPVALAVVIACIVMPTDLSPAPGILAEARLPLRVRSALNVESGLNDGIVAPVFAVALAAVTTSAAGSDPGSESGSAVLAEALGASAVALAVGLGTGTVYGLLVRVARARGWSEDTSIRIGMLAVPLTTYCIAVLLDGNGFVAAFISGVAVHLILREETEQFTGFTKDVVETTSLGLWFVFGVLAGVVFFSGVDWPVVVVSVLALTLLRLVPVGLALVRSGTTAAERFALSLLGPRGVTSLVFGLLAVNAIDDDTTITVLQIMVLTVSVSLLLHGIGAAPVARRLFPSPPRG